MNRFSFFIGILVLTQFCQNSMAKKSSDPSTQQQKLSCSDYPLESNKKNCGIENKGQARLHQTMDKFELMSTLQQMISKNHRASEMSPKEAMLEHSLAVCKFVGSADTEDAMIMDAPLLDNSLFAQESMQGWVKKNSMKRQLLKTLDQSDPANCSSQLSLMKVFQEDIQKAISDKKNSVQKKTAKYETMLGRLRETLRNPFDELLDDPEVAVDIAIARKKMEDHQSQRFTCQFQNTLKKVERDLRWREGLKDAAKDSALNAASFVVGPEMLFLGTLTKASLNLEKIENLMTRLYIHTKNLSPGNLKTLSRDSNLMKELDVEPNVVSEMPEILHSQFKVGYGEFMNRMDMEHALYKQPYLGSELAQWETRMNSTYRQSIIAKTRELATKGVSVNPNKMGSQQSAEYVVSKGVYPNEPQMLLNKIEAEFGSYQNFTKFIKAGK